MRNLDFEDIYPWLIGSLALVFVVLTVWFLRTLKDPDPADVNPPFTRTVDLVPSFPEEQISQPQFTLKKDH